MSSTRYHQRPKRSLQLHAVVLWTLKGTLETNRLDTVRKNVERTMNEQRVHDTRLADLLATHAEHVRIHVFTRRRGGTWTMDTKIDQRIFASVNRPCLALSDDTGVILFVINGGSARLPPDHLLLDRSPNLGPHISRWEINKFENCWYTSVRILEVLKLLFQQFLNVSSSQRNMSGPVLGALSNNRWSGCTLKFESASLRVIIHRGNFPVQRLVKAHWKYPTTTPLFPCF